MLEESEKRDRFAWVDFWDLPGKAALWWSPHTNGCDSAALLYAFVLRVHLLLSKSV
jgi:hypothetical protein